MDLEFSEWEFRQMKSLSYTEIDSTSVEATCSDRPTPTVDEKLRQKTVCNLYTSLRLKATRIAAMSIFMLIIYRVNVM